MPFFTDGAMACSTNPHRIYWRSSLIGYLMELSLLFSVAMEKAPQRAEIVYADTDSLAAREKMPV